MPIIIVSAKDTDSDKSLGLGLGADDYVTKPFSVTEVLARIKANIRRTTQYSAGIERREDTITWGKLTINTEDYYFFQFHLYSFIKNKTLVNDNCNQKNNGAA